MHSYLREGSTKIERVTHQVLIPFGVLQTLQLDQTYEYVQQQLRAL